MTIAESILPEFEHEMANTRKVLERIPDDKLGWKALPKGNTIGWVGAHLAEIAGWAVGVLKQDNWDVSPVGGEPYKSPTAGSRQEILDRFDKYVAEARQALAETTDEACQKDWSLLAAGQPIFTMPRIAVIRSFVISHTIHHRAILTLYLRMNDVPVPGMYGPSGDEQ